MREIDVYRLLVLRVAAATVFLDDQRPGWAEKIDLARLDLSRGATHVVGQLFPAAPNPLAGGLDALGLHGGLPELLGFAAPSGLPASSRAKRYAELTALWTVEIRHRTARWSNGRDGARWQDVPVPTEAEVRELVRALAAAGMPRRAAWLAAWRGAYSVQSRQHRLYIEQEHDAGGAR